MGSAAAGRHMAAQPSTSLPGAHAECGAARRGGPALRPRAECQPPLPAAALSTLHALPAPQNSHPNPSTPPPSTPPRSPTPTPRPRPRPPGPENTPYCGGCFLFDIYFPPDYPRIPPKVEIRTTGGGSVRGGRGAAGGAFGLSEENIRRLIEPPVLAAPRCAFVLERGGAAALAGMGVLAST